MEQQNGHELKEFERTSREHERFKAHVLEALLKVVDNYMRHAATLCVEDHATDGHDLLESAINCVAPGMLERERDFGLELANADELLCFGEVRLNVGFVVGFLLAARVLDGRSPESYGEFKTLLADKLGHAFDCEHCNRKEDHRGNE